LLDTLKPPATFDGGYASILFQGASPDTVYFREREAFQHYLHSLKKQCEDLHFQSFDEAKTGLKLLFETANDLSVYLRDQGVRGKYREFSNVADDTLASIDAFDGRRGLIYQVQWKTL